MSDVPLKYLLLGSWIVSMISCANPSSPKGGPRDETPPEIKLEESTPNEQVFFEKQNIKLVFDEFVNIDKPNTSVVISPPLDVNPRIYARGKEIRVEMPEEEELKENATYVFNFGNSIKDYTEGNEIENYSFIFSTGPYIDSLSISGTVVDAYSGEPAKETLVMLYDDLRDSVVYEKRPFYFARTDDEGLFTINNMRSDSFKLFILQDGNVNYLYDLDTEPIGFLDSFIFITPDVPNPTFNLEVFSPTPDFDMVEYDAKTFGQVILIFNQPSDSVQVKSNTAFSFFNPEISGDSLIVWYDMAEDMAFDLMVEYPGLYYDTIKVRQLSRAEFVEGNSLKKPKNNVGKNDVLKPKSPFVFKFEYPLQDIDQSKCHLSLDSIEIPDVTFAIDSIHYNKIRLEHDFIVDSTYQIKLDSGAIESIYGTTNDSIVESFSLGNEDDFGKIILSIDSLDFRSNYILELMKETKVLRTDIVSEEKQSLLYDLLAADTYTLRVTKDDNKNGRWDPGSYTNRIFSEQIASMQLEAVRAGWDNQVVLSSDIFDKKVIAEMPIDTIQQR